MRLDNGDEIDVRDIDPDKVTRQLGRCPMALVYFLIATSSGWLLFAFETVKMALILSTPSFACVRKVKVMCF